ncbi:DUF2917 domain-containing protein [Ramlibacter sp. XY19]|uniref:DUF2917 domain-containing protein n=1 Tax=Ramlibacter paludis TaxID=2908000 RepID=UPI0023DCDDDF|nr:DUF2917 domain-containing protein [Ramlibacter paludis]MCG2592756.1 DUF2917 domain-containing protein [Ramlibacter paludis]
MLTALFHPANFMTRLLGREDRPQPAPAGIRRLLAVGVKAGRLRELPMGKGRMVVHCRSGEVWITHDGDPRDVVLRQDQSYIVDRGARMTAFALRGDAGLELQEET